MGPAIRVRGIGGLVPAEASSRAAGVEPDGEPSAGWAVVQNNGVAFSSIEGALTVPLSEASEGGAAIGGDRCARDVDGVGQAAS